MSDYFGVSPEGYQKPLYLANNLSDVVDKPAARTNLGVASADDVAKAANPIGTIIAFYGAVAPYGYLPCSGQSVSSSTFPGLVTFLGGTTSATLPDLRGEFLRGWDNGRGVDVGRTALSLQLDALQNIKGTLNSRPISGAAGALLGGSGSTPFGTTVQGGGTAGATSLATSSALTSDTTLFDASLVARTSTETRPRNVSVLYCIKAYDTPVSSTVLNLTSLVSELQLGRSVTSFVNLRSSANGLSATVSTTADEITLKTAATQYRTFTNISVSINTAAVGLNGLDTGTLAISTWYSTWVISDGTNVAGLISLDVLNPTLPAGYTFKARTGWIRTDATAKFPLGFIQTNRTTKYLVASGSNVPTARLMVSGTATSVMFSTSAFAPPTAPTIILTAAGVIPNGGGMGIAPSLAYTTAWPFYLSNGSAGNMVINSTFNMILETPNLYWTSTSASNSVNAIGFEDSI